MPKILATFDATSVPVPCRPIKMVCHEVGCTYERVPAAFSVKDGNAAIVLARIHTESTRHTTSVEDHQEELIAEPAHYEERGQP